MKTCPNCGYVHADTDYAPELDALRLPRGQADLLLRLRQARGGMVTKEQLISFVYDGRADGGPMTASTVIDSYISIVRNHARPFGWTILADRFIGYRLVRAPE